MDAQIQRFCVPADSVVEIRIHPAPPAEHALAVQGDAQRQATPRPAVSLAPVKPRSPRRIAGLPTVLEGPEYPIALPGADDKVQLKRANSQKGRARPPPLRRTRSRSVDSYDAPPSPDGISASNSEHAFGLPLDDDASSSSSLALPGTISLSERRARASTIGAGGLEALELLTSDLSAQNSMRDRLVAKAANSSSSIPRSPSIATSTSVPEALKTSALRSGTPDVEGLAIKKYQSEEAARFRLQRCTPPIPTLPNVHAPPESTLSCLPDPVKRAMNPICNVLEKVTNRVAPCKASSASSTDGLRPETREVLKTIEKVVSVVELDSRVVAREDDARLSSQSSGSERSRFTDRSVPSVATSVSDGSPPAADGEDGVTRRLDIKRLTTGGYDSLVSGVTMAQAINSSAGPTAIPMLPRVV